jgi:hypothetical protein
MAGDYLPPPRISPLMMLFSLRAVYVAHRSSFGPAFGTFTVTPPTFTTEPAATVDVANPPVEERGMAGAKAPAVLGTSG